MSWGDLWEIQDFYVFWEMKFFLWVAIQNAIKPYFFFFFLTKYILPLQVLCGKTNNNNNKDRSDEKPHFCWINVCGRGLLALRGGWGRQQGSACGDAPHPEVAGRHKACSPRLPGKSRECPTNAPQDGGCSPWHAMAKEDIATGQPPDFCCSEQQPYKMPRFPIYTTSILGSSGLSGVIQLLFCFTQFCSCYPEITNTMQGY